MRTRTTRPSRASAVPLPMRLLIARTTSRAVAKSLELRSSWIESPWSIGVATARSTVAPSGMRPALRWLICTFEPAADAPAPPTTRLPCAMRVDLAVGALQRRRDQRAAAQALGVGERRDVDVDRLPGLRERRQLRRHHHGGEVLQLHVGAGSEPSRPSAAASPARSGSRTAPRSSGRRCRRGRRPGRSRSAGSCARPGPRPLP